jgi:RimJ/RimL family protein N-acetyltransferase
VTKRHATIAFSPLRTDDFDLLHRWRSADHIEPWFGPVGSRQNSDAYYQSYVDGSAPQRGYIVLVDGTAIGFAETYLAKDRPEYFANIDVHDDEAAGMDVFIGEATYLGLGSRIIERFVEEVVLADERVSACYVAPDTRNPRSIRVFEKAGFVPLKTVQVPGDDAPAAILRRGA